MRRTHTSFLFSLLLSSLLLGNTASRAATSLEIGYMPIIPVSQAFVVLEGDTLAKAGVTDPKLIKFQNGPAIVQALLAGQLDMAYLGIGPAMVARAKGADIKVVASNIVEQISVIALGELAPYFAEGTKRSAFERFTADKGRKPVIATFPRGSVPETVLQYWLRNQLAIDPAAIETIYQGAAQVQQALLTGAVDGAAILEPVVSIISSKLPAARVVAQGSQLFPNQPGAVLVVRDKLLKEHPQLVQALVAAHVQATEQLKTAPETAVDAVRKYVGGGRLSRDIVLQSLRNSQQSFEADPNAILASTRVMRDFQTEIGTLKTPVDLDTLFDTSVYDQLP